MCRAVNGGACIRNIKTDLPNIDRVGSASLAVALAIGIALASLGGIFMCISIVILYKWRKVCLHLPCTALHTFLIVQQVLAGAL